MRVDFISFLVLNYDFSPSLILHCPWCLMIMMDKIGDVVVMNVLSTVGIRELKDLIVGVLFPERESTYIILSSISLIQSHASTLWISHQQLP